MHGIAVKTPRLIVAVLALLTAGVLCSIAVIQPATAWADLTNGTVAVGRVATPSVKAYSDTSMRVNVKAVPGAAGYQYQMTLNKDFIKNVRSITSLDRSIVGHGLMKGNKYYFRVRAYAIDNGMQVWGSWSKTKVVKGKGTSYSRSKSNMRGTWELVYASNLSKKRVAYAKKRGYTFSLILNKNGRGTYKAGQSQSVTWSAASASKGLVFFPGSALARASASKSKLVIKGGSTTLTFKRKK